MSSLYYDNILLHKVPGVRGMVYAVLGRLNRSRRVESAQVRVVVATEATACWVRAAEEHVCEYW